MTSQTTRSEQKQRHAALAGEIADLLLSAESPVRNQEAFQQFHDEHGQCPCWVVGEDSSKENGNAGATRVASQSP